MAWPMEAAWAGPFTNLGGTNRAKTIRRYLNYLVETGQLLSSIDYETGGRPRVLYRLK